MAPDRGRHGTFVSGHAGDDHCSLDAVSVEFPHPPVGQIFGGSRRLPFQLTADLLGGDARTALPSEDREEVGREEVAVCVVERHQKDRSFYPVQSLMCPIMSPIVLVTLIVALGRL